MKTETDLTKRWEKGAPHHPRSEVLYRLLAAADHRFGDDFLDLKSGGDGDNGEHIMYLLDVIFDAEDNSELAVLGRKLDVAVDFTARREINQRGRGGIS